MMKSILKPFVYVFAALFLSVAILSHSASPARADLAGPGMTRDFLLPLLVIARLAAGNYLTTRLGGIRMVITGPGSGMMSIPLGDGTSLNAFVNRGRVIGYIRTF